MKRLLSVIILAGCISQVFGQQMIPLIEAFIVDNSTESKTFDDGEFTPFLKNVSFQGKYIAVTYRVNDPYYGTAETTTRYHYYMTTAFGLINGSPVPQGYFTTYFNTAVNVTPEATITATYQITGATVATGKVKTSVIITPSATISDAYLFMAVTEKLMNSDLHYVMMKMVPNANGRHITLTANTPITVADTASLSGTEIANMTDIEVVAWVQDFGTKKILQSALATKNSTLINNCLLNGCPSNNSWTMIRNNAVVNAKNARISIHDLSGRCLKLIRSDKETFTVASFGLSRGCYILKVGAGKQAIYGLISISKY